MRVFSFYFGIISHSPCELLRKSWQDGVASGSLNRRIAGTCQRAAEDVRQVAKVGVAGPRSASCARAIAVIVSRQAAFVSSQATFVSSQATFVSCRATFVWRNAPFACQLIRLTASNATRMSHIASLHSLRAPFA